MNRPTSRVRAAITLLPLLIAIVFGLQPNTPAAAQIAPTLAYGTFIGGASDDVANAVVVDAQGNIYIAGYTYSNPFPGTQGHGPYTNAFVTKLDPSGTQVIYSTLIGGTNDEEALALAVDAAGNAWVTGFTESDDMPTIKPIQTSIAGEQDTFVSKIAPNGTVLFQSYLGAPGNDQANAIALDTQGNAYLAGQASWDFGPAVMVKKVAADGSAQIYQAFFGYAKRGFARGSSANGIAVDAQGNAYLVGKTNTAAFDTDGFQDQCVGLLNEIDDCPGDDGYIMILNAAGNAILSGTILGGTENDVATGVALDKDGNIYVTGTTFSSNFPTKNAWQAQKRGESSFTDSFLVKLTPSASEILYGTYYGGTAYDEAHSVVVDNTGRASITGQTSSEDLPVPGAVQPEITGICLTTGTTSRFCYDAFVAAFDSAGALSWSSYLGGTDDDQGNGLAIGPDGDIYVVGRADSSAVPMTPNALQAQSHGFDEAFLIRIGIQSAPPVGEPGSYRAFLPLVRR